MHSQPMKLFGKMQYGYCLLRLTALVNTNEPCRMGFGYRLYPSYRALNASPGFACSLNSMTLVDVAHLRRNSYGYP
jgi:hypothetical protein